MYIAMKLFGGKNNSILKCVEPYEWGVLTFIAVDCCVDEQYGRPSITSSYAGGAGIDNVLPVLQIHEYITHK